MRKLMFGGLFMTSSAFCQTVQPTVPTNSDNIWSAGWRNGDAVCYAVQDGFDKVTSRPFCYEVTGASSNEAARVKSWDGTAKDRPSDQILGLGRDRFFLDKKSMLFGTTGGSNLQFKPFEAAGCLPVTLGKNCLQNLDDSFHADVSSKQYPNWKIIKLIEARYAEKLEKYKTLDGKIHEVVRFTARFQRNDGGIYVRQALYRINSLLPIARNISYYSAYPSGLMEWGEMGQEVIWNENQ